VLDEREVSRRGGCYSRSPILVYQAEAGAYNSLSAMSSRRGEITGDAAHHLQTFMTAVSTIGAPAGACLK